MHHFDTSPALNISPTHSPLQSDVKVRSSLGCLLGVSPRILLLKYLNAAPTAVLEIQIGLF